MTKRQKSRRRLFGLLAAVMAVGAIGYSGGRAAAQTLKLGGVYNAVSGSMAPIWVAQEAGLFAKQHLDLELKYLAATTAVQSMVGGNEQVGLVGNQGIDADLEGADLVYVAAAIPTFVFHLYGDPSIRSAADLKGKVVAATQAAASTDYAARITLSRLGLVPDKEVKILYAGTMPALLGAVKSGNAAAGIMSAPTTLQAKAAGLKEIVNITNLKIPFLFVGVLTSRKELRENPEALTRFLRAYVEAIAVVRRDKETTIKAMGRYLKTDSRQILESVYDEYKEVFPKVPLMTAAEVQAALDVAKSPRAKQVKPEEFFDNSLVEKIHGSGFIDALYPKP